MNKYTKLIIWILVSGFVGGAVFGFLDAAGLAKVAEFWDNFYHMIIGLGIGYFVFRD